MAPHFGRTPHTIQRLHEGPLGPYVDAFTAEMYAEGYAHKSAESQIRLVADFSRWLAKRQIPAPKIIPDHSPPYLRARAQYRHPGRSGQAGLKRLWKLLRRRG